MPAVIFTGIMLLGYLLGSIPFGLFIVRMSSGKDLRQVASGRTGGTNAFRAAGIAAGVGTMVLDVLKGAASVWMARLFAPGNVWLEILAPAAAILGHNYSIFMVERSPEGKLIFRGGAGGAPCVGGAFGLWPPSVLIILPIGALIWYFIGYASVTTMSAALLAFLVFFVRAIMGASPWEYIWYGVIAEILLLMALRPNIKRLMNGTERLHGFRARKSHESQ